jgi:hypothetical protein
MNEVEPILKGKKIEKVKLRTDNKQAEATQLDMAL